MILQTKHLIRVIDRLSGDHLVSVGDNGPNLGQFTLPVLWRTTSNGV